MLFSNKASLKWKQFPSVMGSVFLKGSQKTLLWHGCIILQELLNILYLCFLYRLTDYLLRVAVETICVNIEAAKHSIKPDLWVFIRMAVLAYFCVLQHPPVSVKQCFFFMFSCATMMLSVAPLVLEGIVYSLCGNVAHNTCIALVHYSDVCLKARLHQAFASPIGTNDGWKRFLH